jgi:lysophospholipase L1-like esterase
VYQTFSLGANIKVNIEKNNSVNIERKYQLGMVDLSKATIGEQTEKSTISNVTLYPVLINNTPNGEVSDLFRYSCPVQVSGSIFPEYTFVRMADMRKGGYTVEFYVDDDFEFIVYNAVYAIVIVDDVRVSDGISNVTNYAKCHTKVSFLEKKKHHICLCFGGSVRFHGIITCGVVTRYEDTRLRLISDGDSIVEGSSCIGTAYSQYGCMMATMSHILNMDFMNVGVGGSGYVRTGNNGQPNMVDRFDTYITPYNPDLLVVMAGLNDSGNDIESIKPYIDSYWEKVKSLSPKYVIMISPYSPTPTPNNGNIAIAAYLKEVAERKKYPYIDTINGKTYDAMGNIISEYPHGCLTTAEHREEWYAEYLSGQSGYDGTHPNKVGHEWMGRYLANEVFKICKDDFGIVR